MNTRKGFCKTYRENNVPSYKPPQTLEPQKLDERREKGLCYNCDNRYFKGHKCGEKKLFYIDYEEEDVMSPFLIIAYQENSINPTSSLCKVEILGN